MPVRPVSVGERIKRREDPRLIRGLASYTDDLKLHGGLYASFVRSDYAAGRIERIDASRALSRAGVVAVYPFDDLRGTDGRTHCVARPDAGRDAEHPLLADWQVHWVGTKPSCFTQRSSSAAAAFSCCSDKVQSPRKRLGCSAMTLGES